MRPASVFAKPGEDQAHILHLLHGRYRVALRLIMIWLSLQDWPPAGIAALLGYHPATVRRWIGRYHTCGLAGLTDRPRPGASRPGQPRPGEADPSPAGHPGRLDHRTHLACPGTAGHEPAHPASTRKRAGPVASSPPGGQG